MENKSRIYFSDFFLYFGFLKIRNLQHRSHFLSGIGIFKASHCLTSVLLKIIVFLTLHKSSYHTNTGILILFAFLILIIEIDLTENIHCIKRHKQFSITLISMTRINKVKQIKEFLWQCGIAIACGRRYVAKVECLSHSLKEITQKNCLLMNYPRKFEPWRVVSCPVFPWMGVSFPLSLSAKIIRFSFCDQCHIHSFPHL